MDTKEPGVDHRGSSVRKPTSGMRIIASLDSAIRTTIGYCARLFHKQFVDNSFFPPMTYRDFCYSKPEVQEVEQLPGVHT